MSRTEAEDGERGGVSPPCRWGYRAGEGEGTEAADRNVCCTLKESD